MKTQNKNDIRNLNHNKFKIRFLSCIWCLTVVMTLNFMTSCKKFVEIDPPATQLVSTSVFANNGTATSAVTYIYSQMNAGFSYNISLYAGLSADELKNYSTSADQQQVYGNAINAITNNAYASSWTNGYKYIYQANQIIEGLQKYKGVSPAVGQQLTGEAEFLRAFFHFYLTDFYGDVPLVLTTDYNVTDKLSRTPRVKVLQQIIVDLNDAQSRLNSNYVDISDTLTTTERVRPNKSTAAALLARAYLYLGNYNNDPAQYPLAEAAATSIINSSIYSLSPLTGTNSVFKKNSTETIWSLQTVLPTANYATREGQQFVLIAAPTNVTISTQLFNSFETNDQRKVNWIGSYTPTSTPSNTYYFPYKYKDRNVTAASEYAIVLRLAEQYLIRAEAEAQEGKTSAAITDLNIIRNRAGLSAYSGLTDKASLLTAILHERQVELFTEWGHRWFDLNRTGNVDSVMGSPGNVCQAKGGVWSPNWQLYPIRQLDRNTDPNLTQNPGY